MKLPAQVLVALTLATDAFAFGVQGNISRSVGGPVYPCDIDVLDRQTGQFVVIPNDSTLPNGNYSLTLANGRYDLYFHPPIGAHLFQGEIRDLQVNNNTITENLVLPSGVYLQGRVVDSSAGGVAGVSIRFRDVTGDAPNNVQDDGTLADGSFLTLVDAGVWNVEIVPAPAAHKAPREIKSQNLATDLDLGDVVVQDGWVLSCSVTDAGFFPIADGKLIARTVPGHTKLFTPLNSTSPAGLGTLVVPPGVYDITAEPPSGAPLATQSQYSVVVSGDQSLPNFVLSSGLALSAHCVSATTSSGVADADVDVDWMLPPSFPRVETLGDFTNGLGDFSVLVGTGTYRVTVSPPVATRLIPVRLLNVAVSGPTNLGTLTFPQGHWVNATIREQGTLNPIVGANLDFVDLQTSQLLVTIDDVTNAAGFARVVTDSKLYRLRVIPPSTVWDTLIVDNFRSLADTTVALTLQPRSATGVPGRDSEALTFAAPWPNPARGEVTFQFEAAGAAELSIWDVSGRRRATPWRGNVVGEQRIRWGTRGANGESLGAGVYFARLETKLGRSVQRIVLMH
ncbi:MAG: T9SS type A sorting domain-containing protein [Candidatus Eisenbacteria bacterium]|uniref:T9SS type A sorting domain-containing protein n=1 Tax=Eiseniibacteriota bacterium TaxID=2212470 RepID=A0A849SLF2_UNCEI|nr:T9SS type A sorting domain-containing protein [Candidatus Eisenbacteria bacterium]